MLNIIVFSKDRACQLDATLRSIYKHIKVPYDLSVLYKADLEEFQKGYKILIDIYSNRISFVEQSHFKNDLVNLLKISDYKYTLLLVDDILILRDITLDDPEIIEFISNESLIALSIRMSTSTKYCFFDTDEGEYLIESPEFDDKNIYNFLAGEYPPHWYHAVTACGQVIRTKNMLLFAEGLEYNNPNTFENKLNRIGMPSHLAICYDKPRLMEFAINIVNTTHITNKCGDTDIEQLNTEWLNGNRLDIEPWYELKKHYTYLRFSHPEIKFEVRND